MDIYPTFLEWAGVSAAEIGSTDGKSVAAMVQRNEPSPHKQVFWAYLKQRAVREGEWKLLLNPPAVPGDEVKDEVWLSNLREDPGERINFRTRRPEIVTRLQASLDQWFGSLTQA
jgi:arylsulfatase A-like enzyme